MCQLFAISTSSPTRLNFCWERFTERGSAQLGNPDGWGVCYYQDNDVNIYREPSPAANSPLVGFLLKQSSQSQMVISHVRRSSQGDVCLKNTQPFCRTLAGKEHTFAHNGFVGNAGQTDLASNWLAPVGDTDSERLFCMLLARLEPVWKGSEIPPLNVRTKIIQQFSDEIRPYGAANFIYSDSATLFAHAHRHTVEGDAVSTEPGLYVLSLSDCYETGSKLTAAEENEAGVSVVGNCLAQTLIATRPLDNRDWRPMREAELLCIENGVLV